MNDMSKNYSIRIATKEDFERLTPLYEANSARLENICAEHFVKSKHDFSLFKLILAHSRADILIAESEGECVGTVLVWQTETPSYPNRRTHMFTYITDIIIKDTENKAELFSLLLNEAKKWSCERGCEYIEADLFVGDTEISDLLLQFGFSPLMRAYSLKLENTQKTREKDYSKLSFLIDCDSKGRVNEYCSMREIESECECQEDD